MRKTSEILSGLTASVLLFAVGCATTPSVQKLYEGPDRPDAELATVIIPYTIEIHDINGTPFSSATKLRSAKEQRATLLPGSYLFGFKFSSPYEFGSERAGVTTPRMERSAALEAGHTYRFLSRVKGDDAGAAVDVWIEDAGAKVRRDEAQPTPAPKPAVIMPAAPPPAGKTEKPVGSSLDDLKRSWQSASPDERAEFLKSIVSP